MDIKINKNLLIAFGIWIITMAIIILFAKMFNDWKDRHPIKYCDEVCPKSEYIPVVCKLRYPILNADEIKKLKRENEELKLQVTNLESRLNNVQAAINGEIEDNWEPDIQPRDY